MEKENRVGGTDTYAYHLQCGDQQTKLLLHASPEEVVDLLKDVARILGHPWEDLRDQLHVLYQASRQGPWIPLLNVERMQQTRLLPEFEVERRADHPTKVERGRHSLGHHIFFWVKGIYADHKTLSVATKSLDKASLRTLRLLDKLLCILETVSDQDGDFKTLLSEHGLQRKPLKEVAFLLHASERTVDRLKARYCEALTAAIQATLTPKERLDLQDYLKRRKGR
ncbi:hypothetical protein [Alicyclobacillus sp. SP_1]|uniref:hypothetical protein n=1 Tax=Alicyclobacillus sp. SP_1 TaxID=2942475 RepID=UPI002157E035|nr:hypothetical protein [Alicyclobacillus sp. SP_1]